MLNRWQGNTGKVERIDEKSFERREIPHNGNFPPYKPPNKSSGSTLESIVKRIGKFVPGVKEPLENEDIILLLILYLMYRESGDSELLIIMGAMFLL